MSSYVGRCFCTCHFYALETIWKCQRRLVGDVDSICSDGDQNGHRQISNQFLVFLFLYRLTNTWISLPSIILMTNWKLCSNFRSVNFRSELSRKLFNVIAFLLNFSSSFFFASDITRSVWCRCFPLYLFPRNALAFCGNATFFVLSKYRYNMNDVHYFFLNIRTRCTTSAHWRCSFIQWG